MFNAESVFGLKSFRGICFTLLSCYVYPTGTFLTRGVYLTRAPKKSFLSNSVLGAKSMSELTNF